MPSTTVPFGAMHYVLPQAGNENGAEAAPPRSKLSLTGLAGRAAYLTLNTSSWPASVGMLANGSPNSGP